MGIPAEVQRLYDRLDAPVNSVMQTVKETVGPFAEEHHYIFFGRRKEAASLAEKLEMGRYRAWSELDDLYACTIVVPTADHEASVVEFLNEVFEVDQIRARHTTVKAPDVFRFDTTRVYCRLRHVEGLDRPKGASSIKFEVQIPSAFQYAWAVVTHDLTYKADVVSWEQLRLVAQLKAAVEQIEVVIASFQSSADAVISSGHDETDAKAECAGRFASWYGEGLISASLKPHSWSRFADCVYSLVKTYTRNNQRKQEVTNLLDQVEEKLRSTDPSERPTAGSLFQLVVGIVNLGGGTPERTIARFPLVPSDELALHGIAEVPNKVTFDLEIDGDPAT